MDELYPVRVTAGDFRPADGSGIDFAHRWTEGGVNYSGEFTGAHLLNLAIAGCVLNDVYREAASFGIEVAGVLVTARGGFDEDWSSTGIEYEVQVGSSAGEEVVNDLLARVEEVAEIPKAVRSGGKVTRS